MIPSVTVPPSCPRGFPITTAVSPTDNLLESPIVTGFRFLASTLIMPTSVLLSEPTTFASYSVPSCKRTFIFVAPSITWLFVRI